MLVTRGLGNAQFGAPPVFGFGAGLGANQKALDGSITISGELATQLISVFIPQAVEGTITLSGSLQTLRTAFISLDGTITLSGAQSNGGAFPTPPEEKKLGTGSAGIRIRRRNRRLH